ncbi:MAG: hypothetical protein JST87_19130 [Bacteroidetes bacterium]|nr:hypothetical protein [Bacteroidota bacterium]
MRKIISCIIMLCLSFIVHAQELYVSTEPASNMAAGSIGLRFNSKLFKMKYESGYTYRLDPEIMLGISKKIMVHVNAYASNMYQSNMKFEGGSVYGKYRFLSNDDIHSHFRMAAFGKVSLVNNPSGVRVNNNFYRSEEIELDGSNSGLLAGIVATQLLHKLALSLSVAYVNRFTNINQPKEALDVSSHAANYSFSAGYLLFPAEYKNFRQVNVNLYCEWLGSSSLDGKGYYFDVAPAVQFIFNSIARLDVSYRTQFSGNMQRLSENYFMLKLEYNFLNAFKN